MGELTKPDESKFVAMQNVAQDQGPEAEARRQEMAQWSAAAGAYAERASNRIAVAEKYAQEAGNSPEQTASTLKRYSKESAQQGEVVAYPDVTVRPVKGGMIKENGGRPQLLRSPTNVRKHLMEV
jgi:hypothetical protein